LLSFGQARDASASIGETTSVLLVDGYRAIAHRQAPDRADHSARELDDVIDRLMADGSKQARGFADQLRTAARIFDDRASRRDAEIAEWPVTDIVGSARG
jgi:plasmid stabilization system protein ParE